MEAERDVLGNVRASELVQVAGVEREQERRPAARVEHDREEHPLVLAFGARGSDEHRLAREAALLVPRRHGPVRDVELRELVEEAGGAGLAERGRVRVAVIASRRSASSRPTK